MQMIVINTQFEGFHHYPDAPKEVEFLKLNHRHMFHVEVQIEVFHDDRELEIIMVKRALTQFLTDNKRLGTGSCEMLCKSVQQWLKRKYPAGPQMFERVVHVKVMEDGENGAMLWDDLKVEPGAVVSTETPLSAKEATQLREQIITDMQRNFDSTQADVLHKAIEQSDGLAKYVHDVQELDKKFGLDTYPELTTDNLMFYTTALIGEAGEVANVVKKIVRDGESKELWESLDFEMVDIMIYFIKFCIMTGIDFDAAWNKKHEELAERYVAGKKHLSYGSRKLDRR
jgi:NTP pyrophosphatase (non-canonical NTP hydrolase)